jgi:D-alanine-D-alanine ligase
MAGDSVRDIAVLVLYNRPGQDAGASDQGVMDEVAAVTAALDRLGIRSRTASADRLQDVVPLIQAGPEEVVFNLVESFPYRPEDAVHVPALCEALNRACTGSLSPCLALTLDKTWTRAVLADAGLPVPPGVSVAPGQPIPVEALPAGSLIVKPARADASEGITSSGSIVSGPGKKLERAVAEIHARFSQPALVEALVGERELNISILDRGDRPRVLPLAEIDFSRLPTGAPPVVDYSAKWDEAVLSFHNTPRIIPAPLDEAVAAEVRRMALAAWRAAGCTGYARVDMRLASSGGIFILEINANPDISPGAGFAAALAAAHIPYDDFVRDMVRSARAGRVAAQARSQPQAEHGQDSSGKILIRPCRAEDEGSVLAMLRDARVFRPEECLVGLEVFQEATAHGAASGYHSLVAETGGRVAGWICHGPVPCTVAAHDIYWIVTAADRKRSGIGTALLERAEEEIRRQGGRIIAVETSDGPAYGPARSFYRHQGYVEEAVVRDFYLDGDNKVILVKRLATEG